MAYYFMVESKKGKQVPIEISNSKYFQDEIRKYKKTFAYSLQEIDRFTTMFDNETELRERLFEEGTLPFHLIDKQLSIRCLNKNEYSKVPYDFLYQNDIEYIMEPERLIEKIMRSFYEGDLLLIKKITSRFSEEHRCKTTAAEVRQITETSIRENRLSRHFDELDENNDKLLPRLLKLIILESFDNKQGKVVYKDTVNYRNLHILIALVNYHEKKKNKQEETTIENIQTTSEEEIQEKSKEDKTKKSIHTKSLTLGVNGRGKKKYNLDDQLKFDV